jgi:hypothetical protein
MPTPSRADARGRRKKKAQEEKENRPMPDVKPEFGQTSEKPNPNAPEELARFGFLVGSWRFDARVKLPMANRTPFRERGSAATYSTAMWLRTNTG